MATTDIFSKYIPALSTDIAHAGAVTACSSFFPVPSNLDTIFMSGGNYTVMEHLFWHQMELAFCGVKQSALATFLLANKVDMSKSISMDNMQGTAIKMLRPYVLARRLAPINNNYWEFTGGAACDATGTTNGNASDTHWKVTVASRMGIPLNAAWFNAKERVFTESLAADGSHVKGYWEIVSYDTAVVVLANRNTGTYLPAARKISESGGTWTNGPVNGVMHRGTANITDYESFCAQPPGIIPLNLDPFWFEWTRDALAIDEQYETWRELIMNNNPLYANFYNLAVAQYNKQAGEDFQKRWLNTAWHNAPISSNQTMALCNSLTQITDLELAGARCVGRRANAIGWYEQHVEGKRVHDAQGSKLYLNSLFNSIYNIIRLRQSLGHPNPRIIEIWMPSNYRPLFMQAMLQYYKAKSEGLLQLNLNLSNSAKQSPLGFYYREFELDFPECTIRMLSDPFFDDMLDEFIAHGANVADPRYNNLGRQLWIWDWSKNYMGIIESNRVVNKTNDLKALAAVNNSYRCVMKVPTVQTTLMSTCWTAVSECTLGDLIIENLSADVPEPTAEGPDYEDN